MLIRALDHAAMQLHIPYFVIGATARDILIEHVHGLETTRATRDIDFAVSVASWEGFTQLKEQLSHGCLCDRKNSREISRADDAVPAG